MNTCKYCERPLDRSSLKKGCKTCAACLRKLPDVRRFVEVCDEFKQTINYEAILRKRRREALKKEAKR